MNTDQIAEEAAQEIFDWIANPVPEGKNPTAIIKSAIEKAYCMGVDEMTKAAVEAVSESRAAHASELPAKELVELSSFSVSGS